MTPYRFMKNLLILSLILCLAWSQGMHLNAYGFWSEDTGNSTLLADRDTSNGGSGSSYGFDSGSGSGDADTNASQPRLMVTEFEIDGGSVKPNHTTTLFITFQNCSHKKYVTNIKLSLQEESGDILPVGTGTLYVDYIYAGDTYVWAVDVKASKTGTVGEHKLTITAEYEDKFYTAYTNTDTLLVPVKQKTDLNYSGFTLPKKVIQNQTTTMDITLMNTGRSLIRNAKVEIEAEGLTSGGTTFLGEIASGTSQTANINLLVDPSIEGEVTGTATLSYEDEYGKEYKQTEWYGRDVSFCTTFCTTIYMLFE